MKRIITFWKCQLKDNPRVPSPGLKLGLCFCSVLYWTLSYVFITFSPTKTSEKKFFFCLRQCSDKPKPTDQLIYSIQHLEVNYISHLIINIMSKTIFQLWLLLILWL